jgi:hypothetical protein
MGEAALRVIAHELLISIKGNLSVDWMHRDASRARMRVLVKRILRKYGYPPELQDAAVLTVLQQAEALSSEWAATENYATLFRQLLGRTSVSFLPHSPEFLFHYDAWLESSSGTSSQTHWSHETFCSGAWPCGRTEPSGLDSNSYGVALGHQH